MEKTREPYTFDRVVRLTITIACVIAGLWLLNYLKGVLIPFLVACLIAYMLNPVVGWNRKLFRLKGRVLATILTIIEVTVILGAALSFLGPYIYKEFQNMIVLFNNYAKANFDVPYLPKAIHDFILDTVDIEHLKSLMTRE